FRDGDELAAGATPPEGRVAIEGAWRLGTSYLRDLPPRATLVVISRAARERIVAGRQETARSYAAAWQRFKEDDRDYHAKWPFNPFETFPVQQPEGERRLASALPPRPQPPAVKPELLAAGDVIAYMTYPLGGIPWPPDGADPIIFALERLAPIDAELYSVRKPYL